MVYMKITHIFAIITLLALLSQTTMANTTVTLTGTCSSGLVTQSANYITFNLSNSGNGAASDLILAPQLEGATTPNFTVGFATIAPGSSYSTRFYLQNFTAPGSYVEYITAKYSQGSSSYVTVFPCLTNIMENAQSLLQIMNVSRAGSKLTVDVISLAPSTINANITVAVPLTFKVSPPSIPISITSKNQTEATFNFSTPNYSDAQFPIVAAVSYVSNGVHYAALDVHVISFATSASPSSSGLSVIDALIILVLVIIVILLVVSILKKKKPKNPAPAPQTPQAVQDVQAT